MRPSLNHDSPASIREYLEKKKLGMQKKFGQNFLINGEARRGLAGALGICPGDHVWEIGPGLGAMTAELLKLGARVTAFEIDRGFCLALKEDIFRGEENLSLVCGDVRKTWVNETGGAQYLFGNLPYNVGALILAGFIEAGRCFRRTVVTVQREVAVRMAARPGSKDYSSFSVLCSSAYSVKPLMTLKPSMFFPAPRVDSQAVLMEFSNCPGAANSTLNDSKPALFTPLVRCLFSSRRKTLHNNLQKFLSSRIIYREAAPELSLAVLGECGLNPAQRAENLGIEEFRSLARAVETLMGKAGNGN